MRLLSFVMAFSGWLMAAKKGVSGDGDDWRGRMDYERGDEGFMEFVDGVSMEGV